MLLFADLRAEDQGRGGVRWALENFEFVTRSPDLPVGEVRRYWTEHHGPLAAGIDVMRRYVQSHTIEGECENGAPAWEGTAITWLDGIEGMWEFGASPMLEATRADEEHFLGAPLRLPFTITTEHAVVG